MTGSKRPAGRKRPTRPVNGQEPGGFPGRLQDLGVLLERQTLGEENLAELAAEIACVLGVPGCAIVLLPGEAGGGEEKVGVFPDEGDLVEGARAAAAGFHGEIAGKVAAAGRPLSLPEVAVPAPAAVEKWPGGVVAVPLYIGGITAGALIVPLGKGRSHLGTRESELLSAVALNVGMSIEMARLKNLLQSRFAQMALAREGTRFLGSPMDLRHLETGRYVRIIAKTFYREMTRAGFGPGHIIDAAAEIISLLGEQVRRHNLRQSRRG